MACPVAHPAHRKHDRHFHQHTHNRGQRRAGIRAKKSDRGSHRELEEIARTDQGPRRSDGIRDSQQSHQSVSQPRIAVHLYKNRYADQDDMQRSSHDVVCLKGKDKNQSSQQCGNCDRGKAGKQFPLKPLQSVCANQPKPESRTEYERNHDESDYRVQQHLERNMQVGSTRDEKAHDRRE